MSLVYYHSLQNRPLRIIIHNKFIYFILRSISYLVPKAINIIMREFYIYTYLVYK